MTYFKEATSLNTTPAKEELPLIANDAMRKIKTTCPYCGTGCNFELNVQQNKITNVTTAEGNENGKSICVKGRFGYGFIQHPDRLTNPLIKKNGKFVKASWYEAINLVAKRLREIKKHHGSDSLAVLSSARCTNEENYLLQKFTRAVLKTNNIDHCARLCHAPTVAGLNASFGSGAMTNSISEIAGTNFILAIGTNTTETHPVIGIKISKAIKAGAKLAVVDPRQTKLAKMADYHLQLKSGSDIALLNGLAHVIIAENLWNKDFVTKRTDGFNLICRSVKNYPPNTVEKITGIPAETIIQVAREYASAKNAMIIFTMGLTQHVCGTHNVFAVANLAMLCGQIGKPHSGVNPLRGQNNVQGSCDMGALPNVFPGYQSITNSKIRHKFCQSWQVAELPATPGLTISEMIPAADNEKIKAMYIMGENPLLSDPNTEHTKQALSKLDFLVVQDIFLTETAQMADVVLPAAVFAEKDGTFTNTERRVQRVRKALNPPGTAKTDWEIICLLSEAMGYKTNYRSPKDIMTEIAYLTPSYGGISYDRLEKGGLQWPCPTLDHPGTPVLHVEEFVSGKGKFHPVEHIPPAEVPDAEYPLILNTGRRLFHYHTGTMTMRSEKLEKLYPEEFLDINPADAEKLHLPNGCWVKVTSRRGAMKVRIRITDSLPPGMVFTTFHFSKVAVNKLTNSAYDPISKIPELKICAVKIQLIKK